MTTVSMINTPSISCLFVGVGRGKENLGRGLLLVCLHCHRNDVDVNSLAQSKLRGAAVYSRFLPVNRMWYGSHGRYSQISFYYILNRAFLPVK